MTGIEAFVIIVFSAFCLVPVIIMAVLAPVFVYKLVTGSLAREEAARVAECERLIAETKSIRGW